MRAIDWRSVLRAKGARLDFESGSRGIVVSLCADESILAREYGGPIHSMGALVNRREPYVRAWRWGPPSRLGSLFRTSLRAGLCSALVAEKGFPFDDEDHPLRPDERPSTLTVVAGGDTLSIGMPDHFLEAHPALVPHVAALDAYCVRTQREPSSETIPNPELSLW